MVEEEGKKDEEKFEFTAQGEALGYISLDQARVGAIEHARDNQEFYGRRYAERELVWVAGPGRTCPSPNEPALCEGFLCGV